MGAPDTAPERRAWKLRDAEPRLRLLITAFLLILTSGYAVGLLFVHHTTSATPAGISGQYRGTPESAAAEELKYAKSADELFILVHNHVVSLCLLFFVVGGLFAFSSIARGGLRTFLMIEPFAAIATTFGGIWLTRFASEHFSWIVLLSGLTMAACYAVMVALILTELWFNRSK